MLWKYPVRDKQDPGNYRPISLLSTFSKIFESLMKKSLTNYLETNSILSTNQFGFRKGKSTFDSLNILTGDLYSALDNHQSAVLILIDFTKAFDTVNHKILLSKMSHYGIRGKIQDWFRSYLTNRSQVTSCNNIHSSSSPLRCGVPQGSIVNPLQFLCVVNDMPITVQCKLLLYANDI